MAEATGPDIRYLGDLQRLELKPGDHFVLMVPRPITAAEAARIQETWERHIGAGVGVRGAVARLLILEDGMKLGVINDAAPGL